MGKGLNPGLGLAILRIVLGVIFIAHGWPKFGGMEGTAGFLASLGVPAPALAAWGIALLETVGGLLLVVGAFVTPVAALLTVHMVTGIFLVHIPNGFYVIGPGSGGYEFNLVLSASLLAMIFVGAGNWALQDRLGNKDVLKT
ncbi:MAG: DoxX family protein [Gemmatimonadota bacterium]|nr:DoxX family protein [Gemmatimonadota bacterium]